MRGMGPIYAPATGDEGKAGRSTPAVPFSAVRSRGSCGRADVVEYANLRLTMCDYNAWELPHVSEIEYLLAVN